MDKKTLLIICIAVIVVFEVLRRVLINSISNRLTRYLMQGDFKSFDALSEQFLTRYLIPVFNLDFMKMNSYLARGDEENTNKIFEHFDQCRLNKAQKYAVASNAFYYYLSMEEDEKCRKYYQTLKENDAANKETEMADWLYDAYVEGGCRYLDRILEVYGNAQEQAKPQLEALLARNYENKGDKKNANLYNKKLKQYAEELDKKLTEQGDK